MKKISKILTICAAVLSLTACENPFKKSDGPSENQQQEEQQQTNVAVESVSLDQKTLDLYVTGSAYLKATVAPENATNKYLTWSSSDEDIAIVSATGKVTGLRAGTATIKVESQADSTKFDECAVTVSVRDDTVHVTSVTLDRESADIFVHGTVQLNATVLPENATHKGVSYASDNLSVAYVDGSGNVVGVSEGDAVITASSVENPTINDSCTVHVSVEDTAVHVTGLVVTPTEIPLDLGGTTSVKPTVEVQPENATNKALTWSSSDPSKVVVDNEGTVIALAVTSEPVIVTVASVDRPAVSRTISVTVVDTTDHSVHVTGVSLPENLAIDLKNSSSATLTATVTPSNAGNKQIEWSSSDPTTVQIGASVGDTSVTLNALKTGTATITATSVDGSFTDTCEVTVSDSTVYVTDVIIKKNYAVIENLDITLGSFEQVVATVLPEDADNQGIVWEMQSGAEAYISLSSTSGSNLTIFGNAATPENTTFKVTAKSAENGSIKAELNVTVTDPTIHASSVLITEVGIVGERISTAIEKTRTITLQAQVKPDDATHKEIEWVIPEDNHIIATPGANNTLTIYGQTATTSPIVIRAKAEHDPEVFSEISVSVIDPALLDRFVNFSDPSDYIVYKQHTAENNLRDVEGLSDDSTLSSNFYKYDDSDLAKKDYKVGDQGAFHFAPIANVKLAGSSESTTISNISTSKKLYLIEGSSETEVTFDEYCTVSADNDYQFKSVAADKKFKLEIMPDDNRYYISASIQPYEFIFSVVHGYNVDEVSELSLFDNSQTEWAEYKADHNLSAPAQGGIVLHKDLSITTDIIPSQFLQSEADLAAQKNEAGENFEDDWALRYFGSVDIGIDQFIGSPKDYITVFNRDTNANDAFDFEGNFFQVDCSRVKPVYKLDVPDRTPALQNTLANGLLGDGSHSQLFGVNVENSTPTEQHNVTMRNFSIKGNGDLNGGVLKKGGLIAFKLNSAKFKIENAVMSDTFISFMTEENSHVNTTDSITEMNADRVTSYNSYSNMFYLFGTYKNNVTNSWLSQCGGPLILMDEPINHAWYQSYMKCSMDCENCYLFNEVMGTEPWFEGHPGSSLLVQGFVVNPGLNGAGGWYNTAAGADGRTIARTDDGGHNVCNLIAIDVAASKFADNDTVNLQGSFTVNNGENATAGINMKAVERDAEGYSVINKETATYLASLDEEDPRHFDENTFNCIPYMFMSNPGTLGIFDGSKLVDASSFVGGGDLFSNHYVCGYLNPMSQVQTAYNLTQGKYIGIFLGTYAK